MSVPVETRLRAITITISTVTKTKMISLPARKLSVLSTLVQQEKVTPTLGISED